MITMTSKLKTLAVISAAVFITLTGCASNKPTYSVVVPVARSDVFIDETQLGNQKFELRYKTNAQGSPILRTLSSEGSYIGGGRESYDAVQNEAKTRMIRQAIDEVNGVLISAKTEIVQKRFSNGEQSAGYEDFKDETLSKVMGVARVIGEPKCLRQSSEPGTTKIHCTGFIEVPLVDIVTLE